MGRLRKLIPRFSLRTLVVFLLLVTSGMGLWWRRGAWRCELLLPGGLLGVARAFFTPDGERIVTIDCVGPGRVLSGAHVWDARTGKCLVEVQGHASARWAIQSTPDARRMLLGTDRPVTTVEVWEPGRSTSCTSSFVCGFRAVEVKISPNGSRGAAFGGTTLVTWDVSTGRPLAKLEVEPTGFRMAFSPDGRRLAIPSVGYEASIFDTDSGDRLTTLEGHQAQIDEIRFSPDGQLLVTSSAYDTTTRLWNVSTGRSTATLTGRRRLDRPNSVVSADGSLILTYPMAPTQGAALWNVATGKPLCHVGGYVSGAAVSPGGGLIATTFYDRTVGAIWDARSGRKLAPLGRRTDGGPIAFSPDGERIVTHTWRGSTASIFRRQRPEQWWGVFWLWEFWLTVVFAGVFVWSVWRDRRALQRASVTPVGGEGDSDGAGGADC